MFDVLTTHILKRLEAFPDATFRESELVDISKKAFNQLVKDGYLEFDHYDEDGDSYFSDRIGDGHVQRTIRMRNDKITAFSSEAGVSTIELAKPEITYYRFNINKLIEQIRTQNKLEEQSDAIDERMTFIGSIDVSGDRTAFFIAMFASEEDFDQNLVGLPNKTGKYSRFIALSPFNRISSQQIKSRLEGINVSHFVFDEAFEKGWIFKKGFPFKIVKESLPLKIHITGRVKGDKNIIQIDGQESGLTHTNLRLLLRLVLGLKKEKDGCVATSVLADEKLIVDSEKAWQAINRLKEDLKRSFNGYDFNKFIKNERKKYRLVIPADSVTYDKNLLKKIKGDAILSNIVSKLPNQKSRAKI